MLFAEGTIVRFDVDGTIKGKGMIRGISTNELPVIGSSWIVEVVESDPVLPNESYPYSHMAIFGCHIKEVLG